MKKLIVSILSVVLALGMSVPAFAQVEPPAIDLVIPAGGSAEVAKEVTTPSIPLVIDVVLLEDETGSFGDDIANLQGGTTAADIHNAVVAGTADAQFGVAGFRDYPEPPYGYPGDWVYRELSTLSPALANWLAGVGALTAGGGNDTPEAQYDAIVAAATSGTLGWRPGAQHVLVVTTDAPFHTPDGTHLNDQAATIAALNANNIVVIGLKALGAGGELDALAAATGGSVQPLSSDGANIGQAILDGLAALTTDVWWEVTSADPGLTVTLTPDVHNAVAGNTMVNFTETIEVAADAPQCAPDNVLNAVVTFYANHYPGEGQIIGEQKISVTVPDTTAPTVWSVETVNPHGKHIPPAGSTTLPGPKGGINEDGFYQLLAEDNCDPSPAIYVIDPVFAVTFGPFASGDVIKFTESPGIAAPEMKKMGSTNGQAGAVATHLILGTDPVIVAVDVAGNVSDPDLEQLIPPSPK